MKNPDVLRLCRRRYNFKEQIWIAVRSIEFMEGALRGSAYRKERIRGNLIPFIVIT